MSVAGSGAYELKHCGKIHRASNYAELKDWILESRVTAEDSFRVAGSEKWVSVMEESEFAFILSPDNQWIVSMKTGVFSTHQFETIIKWAEEGRITDDAVIEGPRTPPGGVLASALPALASNLVIQSRGKMDNPVLRIDGREFPASDTETIREWIKGSMVPVEAEISLKGKDWEPVSTCGLFDLEDWPKAAHGRIEEERLPEMPPVSSESTVEKEDNPVSEDEGPKEENVLPPAEPHFREIIDVSEGEPEEVETDETPYTVFSGNSEMTVESVSKLKSMLREKQIFSYDEIKHVSILEETMSVGEYLDGLKSPKKNRLLVIILWMIVIAAIAVSALEYFEILDLVTWLP